MKELMLGNKALARGLYEAGCSVVSSYPGTPSTEVTEEISQYRDIYSEWAPNEKVAMEVAYGASLAGKRSMCAMKHVGMNVAADPMYTASYTGVNAGMVINVYNDNLWGTVVEIDHGGMLIARYCGLENVSVTIGDAVEIGDRIGAIGKIPVESGQEAHLHFETKLDGKLVNPLDVMSKTE